MATITSNQTGDWDATSTWVGGSVPAADDSVVIAHGHKVTLDTNIQSTRTGDVTIDGNLHFADGGKMHLHGRMTVKNTSNHNNTAGEFVEGTSTSGSLLSMAGGSEIKISGSNADQHGIVIDSRRWCGVDLAGSEPTLTNQLNGAVTEHSSYLTLDSVSNFAAGDMISLYEREVDYRVSPDECFYVHDVDTTNKRLYIRQYVSPKSEIISSSGATITVKDASVFRVGYMVVFGTGSNRNAMEITGIERNKITFGSNVTGTVTGKDVYVSGTEKPHPDNRTVRRLATSLTSAITSLNSTNQISVGNASDFSVGDEILIEASSDSADGRQYVSGSETNGWRLNLMYKITAISGTTITVNRNIPYYSLLGSLVVRLTRDIIIKACKTDGTDVPDGDQDSARVFFNVRYWTSTGWNNTPTRRVKVKYVQFKGLGYNTNDTTNYRGGVVFGGYNGRFDTDRNGSAADETTIHTANGISQTGENYIDGCVVTAYNLCSNTTRDGDSYPSLMIRHPYGHVTRNNVTLGTARGIWRWSSGYFHKSSGNICMVGNYSNYMDEANYDSYCSHEYGHYRYAEDYGVMFYNHRQNDEKFVRHLSIKHQHQYAMYFGSLNTQLRFDKIECDKFRYFFYAADTNNGVAFVNSKVYPNLWDATNNLYNNENGFMYSDRIYIEGTSHNDLYRNSNPDMNRFVMYEQGFKSDEYWEFYHKAARLKRAGNQDWEVIAGHNNYRHIDDSVFVPANTTVKIQSNINIETKKWNGDSNSIGSTSYPYLFARPQHGFITSLGRQTTGGDYDSSKGGTGIDETYINNDYFRTSTQAQGKLYAGFFEAEQHTSSSHGSWESKTITIQPQKQGYMLQYGLYWGEGGTARHLIHMKDFKVLFTTNSAQPIIDKGSSRKSVKSSFDANKKRIGGTRL